MLFDKNKELTSKNFMLDPCKATPGFEFFCKANKKLDLEKLLKKLKLKKYFIEKDSVPFFIIVKKGDLEVSIFKSLKIIIKGTNEESKAKELLDELLVSINSIL